MNTSYNLDYLNKLLKDDEQYLEQRYKELNQYATICPSCKRNTATGRRPFWHRFARSLCDSCGREYTQMLKEIKAWDD